MKKVYVLLIALVMLLGLGGCSNSGSASPTNGSDSTHSEPEVKTLADDTTMKGLVVVVPEGYDEVYRYVEQDMNGTIIEKDLGYTFADGKTISYALMSDTNLIETLGEDNLNTLEKIERDGLTFYLYDAGEEHVAFVQYGDDAYGLDYTLPGEENTDSFKEAINAIEFKEDNREVLINDSDLYDINYTVDSSLPLYGISNTYTENNQGQATEKSITWKFGESDANMDYRFMIRVYKNSTLEEQTDPQKTYEEKTNNDITYTVLTNDDGAPYDYFVEHNGDVYRIRNNGANNGWFTSRSEDSEKAFEAFLNTISFK